MPDPAKWVHASCGKKKRHKSGHVAINVLMKWVEQRADVDLYKCIVYPCRFCQGWHIGSPAYMEKGTSALDEGKQLVIFRRSRDGKSIIGWNSELFDASKNPNGPWRSRGR